MTASATSAAGSAPFGYRKDPAGVQPPLDSPADAITGARLEVLDPAAHLANLEQSNRFNALLLDHLGQHRDGGRASGAPCCGHGDIGGTL